MDVTSIGHAGMLIEAQGGSILCDPWFEPAFFGSWFPFPRNDRLSEDLQARIENADFLYISHLHGDHHDEPWLREHLRRDIPILLPGFPTREQQRTLAALGFTEFIRTEDTIETEIAPGLKIAIHIESSITDGPGGDSALVVMADDAIVVDQNDCRTTDLGQLRSHGPVDLHWLQFSGAVAVNGNTLAFQLIGEEVGLPNIVDRCVRRQVDGFADGGVGMPLPCRLHPNVPLRTDVPGSAKHGFQRLGQRGKGLDRAVCCRVLNDLLRLRLIREQPLQRGFEDRVDLDELLATQHLPGEGQGEDWFDSR